MLSVGSQEAVIANLTGGLTYEFKVNLVMTTDRFCIIDFIIMIHAGTC